MTELTKDSLAELIGELKSRSKPFDWPVLDALKSLALEAMAVREALTPSADTKAAYIGEFSVPLPERDKDGNEAMRQVNVPWTTIKQIMAAIKAHALASLPKVQP